MLFVLGDFKKSQAKPIIFWLPSRKDDHCSELLTIVNDVGCSLSYLVCFKLSLYGGNMWFFHFGLVWFGLTDGFSYACTVS